MCITISWYEFLSHIAQPYQIPSSAQGNSTSLPLSPSLFCILSNSLYPTFTPLSLFLSLYPLPPQSPFFLQGKFTPLPSSFSNSSLAPHPNNYNSETARSNASKSKCKSLQCVSEGASKRRPRMRRRSKRKMEDWLYRLWSWEAVRVYCAN